MVFKSMVSAMCACLAVVSFNANAAVVGTSGDDLLFFSGSLGQFTETITNPYSGESIAIDEQFNRNDDTYDGLTGFDTLLASNVGDVLLLRDSGNNQTLFNVEEIIAGNGGDVLHLADTSFILGDLLVNGGNSGDIIWTNSGNDTIITGAGNDIVNAGPGNDTIALGQFSNLDSNVVRGGDGTDNLTLDFLSTEIQLFSSNNLWFQLVSNGGGSVDFTGIENIQFNDGLFLTSEIPLTTVPVPAAVWLFGSGLVGLIGIARRKKS